MTNNMQRNILSMKLNPCPFCGSDRVKLTYDVASSGIKGVYCSGCTGFTKFNRLIAAKATPEEWRDRWNGGKENVEG